jgi:hypothetical protein
VFCTTLCGKDKKEGAKHSKKGNDNAYLGSVGKIDNKVIKTNKGRHQTGEQLSFCPKKMHKTSSHLVFVKIFKTAKREHGRNIMVKTSSYQR